MTDDSNTAEFLLDLLVRKAKSLRDAGVLHVELPSCTFDLAPSDEPLVPANARQDNDEADPLKDPATYGRHGSVPGFTRRPRNEDGD